MADYSKEKFLNNVYSNLHMKEEVIHSSELNDTKYEKIRKYLYRLENTLLLAKNNKYNGTKLLKEIYYKKYVIKEENIPDSYYEHQKEIVLQRGLGHVEIDDKTKKEIALSIINEQKNSLDVWLDYFMSSDTIYPEWFKYYVFQGMVRLGNYNKEKGSFNKRTYNTTSAFVDLDREALSLIYDSLCSVIEGQIIDDNMLKKLIENGSFSKMYAYMIRKLDKNRKEIVDNNDGIWIKYNQGSNPKKLVDSLEGKGTGWCTAGLETARRQLLLGDFYVYYTKDSDNNYNQPRIAIRMEENNIGEIRGIADNQNLETEMQDILDEKLQEFPDKDIYNKKVSDMKKLTDIYKEYNIRKLTIEELRFLYEIDNCIDGFGYNKDPRIEEILQNRNIKKDLCQIFNCNEDEISDNRQDILDGKEIKCFYGYLNLNELETMDNLKLPNIVLGDLDLEKLKNAENLKLPEIVKGFLDLRKLEIVDHLKLPNKINGSLFLNHLKKANKLELPEIIKGGIHLNELEYIENLEFPEIISSNIFLSELKYVKNLRLPKEVTGYLFLPKLKTIENLKLPEKSGSIYLDSLQSVKQIIFPKIIDGSLFLSELKSLNNVIFSDTINGDVFIKKLKKAKNITFPKMITGDLNLESLEKGINIILPETITGDLNLDSLKSISNITFPKEINGNLILSELKRTKHLKLPDKIDGSLYLNNLRSNKNIVFPEEVNGQIFMKNDIDIKIKIKIF